MPGIQDSKSILITGGTSGIGRALALAISELPSKPQVIATGRREERLKELAAKGLETRSLDLSGDPRNLKEDVEDILGRYPEMDSVIFCAGIQHEFHFLKPETIKLENVLQEITVNYTSIVSMVTHLLPHFQKRSLEGKASNIVVVTSGLAIVPVPWVPNYSATKAALHSFTISLRASLSSSNIRVIEVFPPLVESELHDAYGTTEKLSKFWMPLDEFMKLTIPPLLSGEENIPIGRSAEAFEKFEKGKSELAMQIFANRK